MKNDKIKRFKKLVIYPEDIVKYKCQGAIVLGCIKFWIMYHYKKKDNKFDGLTWTGYLSTKNIATMTGLSVDIVDENLKKLIKQNAIIERNFNKVGFDRTRWYAIPKVNSPSGKSTTSHLVDPPLPSGKFTGTIPKRATGEAKPKKANLRENTSRDTSIEKFSALSFNAKSNIANSIFHNCKNWYSILTSSPSGGGIDKLINEYYILNEEYSKEDTRNLLTNLFNR